MGRFRITSNVSIWAKDSILRFSVATVMFTTTVMIAVQMKFVKHLHVAVAIAFFAVFGFLDGILLFFALATVIAHSTLTALFWGAALAKVPEGAWVSLLIGVILYALYIVFHGTVLIYLLQHDHYAFLVLG